MIRIALCDDEITALESLTGLVQAYAAQQDAAKFSIRRFHSVYDLMECIENAERRFQIYFLDIIMPVYNGIEVGKMIREADEEAIIIYTTTSREFALEAYETSPLQYLVKPITPQRLGPVLDSACRKVQHVDRNILIPLKDSVVTVGLHQIESIEYRSHVLYFSLADGRVLASRSIRESFTDFLSQRLNDPRLLKPHASFAINMEYVRALLSKEFEMASGARIPISKRIYSQVKHAYIDFIIEKNGVSLL